MGGVERAECYSNQIVLVTSLRLKPNKDVRLVLKMKQAAAISPSIREVTLQSEGTSEEGFNGR